LFIDGSPGGGGISHAATGYHRSASLVVLSDRSVTLTHARVAAHNRFRRTGMVAPHVAGSAAERIYDSMLAEDNNSLARR